MNKQKRWIKSVIETAAQDRTAMPWHRGHRTKRATDRNPVKGLAARTA